MTPPTFGPPSDPSLRILALPLGQFVDVSLLIGNAAGLPAGVLEIASANLLLAATPCSPPMFREALARACVALGRDVLLVRTGLFPETLDPVTADIALTGLAGSLMLNDFVFMRQRDARLWLVPQGHGPYVELRHDGLSLGTEPPFKTWDERADGVCRAAAEIVRIATRGRVR